jgi:hypothetical protein
MPGSIGEPGIVVKMLLRRHAAHRTAATGVKGKHIAAARSFSSGRARDCLLVCCRLGGPPDDCRPAD